MKAKITLPGTLVISFCALLGACNDGLTTLQTPPPPTKDVITTQKLENVPDEFTFIPITKVGCDTLEQIQGYPMSEYFQAFEDPDVVNVELAQQALVKLHKQLRCMSEHDLYTNYKRLMYDLEVLQEEDSMWATRVVPLLYLLTEHDVNSIDIRAKIWLWAQGPNLKDEWDNYGYFNNGVGFFFARAEGLVKMEDDHAILLVDSFSSSTWVRAQCQFVEAVFLEDSSSSTKMLCLNDFCPIPNEDKFENIQKDDDGVPNYEHYSEACSQARGALDNATGAGSPTSPSNGSSPTPGQNQIQQVAQCIIDHSTHGKAGYTCAVRVAIGSKSLGQSLEQNNSILTGVDFNIHSNGCATNPYFGQDAEQTPEERMKIEKENNLYAVKRSLEVEMQKELDELKHKNNEIKDLKAICTTTPAFEECGTLERLEQEQSVRLNCLQATCGPGEADYKIHRKSYAVDSFKKSLDKEYGEDRSSSDRKHNYRGPYSEKCEDGFCSQTCSSKDTLKTASNSCLGIKSTINIETGHTPQPLEEEMSGLAPYIYPSPEQWVQESSALSNCVSQAMGWSHNIPDYNSKCGQLILCEGSTYSATSTNNQCSCSGSSSNLPSQITSRNCSNLIQCDSNQSTPCTCSLSPSQPNIDLPTAGGLPGGPEIFMQSGTNWTQNWFPN